MEKYRDRPADEGKHGDAAEEPNAGVPSSPSGPPVSSESPKSGRKKPAGQAVPTQSPEADSKRFGRPPKDHGTI